MASMCIPSAVPSVYTPPAPSRHVSPAPVRPIQLVAPPAREHSQGPHTRSTRQLTPTRQTTPVSVGSDCMLQKRVAALEALLTAQQEQPKRTTSDAEVKDLRKMVERLQKQQDEMARTFEKLTETTMVAVDTLNGVEAQVDDLHISVDGLRENQEADMAGLRKQNTSLFEQHKNLHDAVDKQSAEAKGMHQNCMKHMQEEGERLSSLCKQCQTKNSELVANVQTALVMEQSRIARQDFDNECAFQSLHARLDALTSEQKSDEAGACAPVSPNDFHHAQASPCLASSELNTLAWHQVSPNNLSLTDQLQELQAELQGLHRKQEGDALSPTSLSLKDQLQELQAELKGLQSAVLPGDMANEVADIGRSFKQLEQMTMAIQHVDIDETLLVPQEKVDIDETLLVPQEKLRSILEE